MQVLRESFDDTMEQLQNELAREKFIEMEEDAAIASWEQQSSLMHQEELTDTITLEDELANISVRLMIKTETNEIKIAGQKVEWLKKNTTINPDKIICWEHPNFAEEILFELDTMFCRNKLSFWPIPIQVIDVNLVIRYMYHKR